MSESNHLTQHTVIDNSVEYAVKTGSYRKPKADFYRKLMKKAEWKELLAEAYLVAPLENMKNEADGITPYTECSLKYPHHVLQNEKLVLSVPALEAAYAEVKRNGECCGEIKRHLERHMQDLKGMEGFDLKITSDMEDVCELIQKESEKESVYFDAENPTKEEAIYELLVRKENIADYVCTTKSKISSKNNERNTLLTILALRNRMIERDIHSIINGRYNAAMMEKYRKLTTLTYEAILDERIRNFMLNEEIAFYSENMEAAVQHQKHYNLQQYCYRIGFDVHTGRQVAVEFNLDTVDQWNREEIRYNYWPKAKGLLEKYGAIGYRTDALRVNAIFERGRKRMDRVKFIGLFSLPVMEAIKAFIAEHPKRTKGGNISSAELFDMRSFQEHLVDCLEQKFYYYEKDREYEEYIVDTICGSGKYKTTRLLWDRELLLSYKVTPIARGYNDPWKDEYGSRRVWYEKMLRKLRGTTVKDDLSLMRHLVKEHSEWWMAMGILLNQEFILEALNGAPVIKNSGAYTSDPSLETIYFETMMKVNGTVVNEFYMHG